MTLAPASASALAIAKPKPPSSAIPTTNARRPVRSIFNTAGLSPISCVNARPGEPALFRALAARSCTRRAGPAAPELGADAAILEAIDHGQELGDGHV